ncbi:MAG TPA: glycosyltransferase family A protein [Kineosporiaceae bacterium]|nr:glycosyltransferase family A protein [Kineosporiaceae bacterium]
MSRIWRTLTWIGSAGAIAATAHTFANLSALRRPVDDPAPVPERVSVLIPARDEAARIGTCLASVRDQVSVPDLEILVLDDGSSDGTAEAALRAARKDPRVRILTGDPLPDGWLGKPHACDQLARAATGTVLVFLDADVVLAPQAVAATVQLLRAAALDLVSPYPRQLAESWSERLVQPLLQWSWLTFLPLGRAEGSPRPSVSAGNGQLLAVDAEIYRRVGGHRAVRTEVLDDVALVRTVKAGGGRGGVVDGTGLATCRMYRSWPELRDGYDKSLWAAFGSPAGAAAVVAGLGVLYVVPAVAALRGSLIGLVGYGAAVTGRYVVAERTGGRSLPDSLAHPASVALLGVLTGRSWLGHRQGTLQWKGRPVPSRGAG